MSAKTVVVARVAKCIQTVMTSASAKLGADCILHARFAQYLFRQNAIQSRLVVGEASWRVGPGDGDVIAHSPSAGGFMPFAGEMGLPMHAWLEVDGKIFDCTTHTLRLKARELDACDGGKTTVAWAPPYLWIEPMQTVALKDVAQALQPGAVCYREIPELLAKIQKAIDQRPLDPEDLMVLRMVYANPDAVLVGPRDLQPA